MPYTERPNGIRIHYRVEGIGVPLVLLHGLSGSLLQWQELGYVRALKYRHQLVLIDIRGHGLSSKPHEPEAYLLPELAADVVAVLDSLRIDRTHFLGYSMGSRIGFALAILAPERVRSWILGGAHAFPVRTGGTFRGIDGTDADAFVSAFGDLLGERIPQDMATRLCANDLEALVALIQDRPSQEAALTAMTQPSLLLAGEADPAFESIKECAARIPNASFVPLPGLSHLTAFFRSDLVLHHIQRFLETV